MKQLLFITVCSISTIEWLQLITKRGSLDIDDFILNVLGVCLGYLIYSFFQKVLVNQVIVGQRYLGPTNK